MAIEIVDLPIENDNFPIVMLIYQRVIHHEAMKPKEFL